MSQEDPAADGNVYSVSRDIPRVCPDPIVTVNSPIVKLRASRVTFRYGKSLALKDVSVSLYLHTVTAFMGPSGCGKSTLLRVFNRIYDLYPDQHVEGEVLLDGKNLFSRGQSMLLLCARA